MCGGRLTAINKDKSMSDSDKTELYPGATGKSVGATGPEDLGEPCVLLSCDHVTLRSG